MQYTQRGKTHVVALRVHGDMLAIQNVCWPDELRQPDFVILKREVKLDPKAVKVANQLVESLLGEFDAADYVDTYTAAVNDLIDAKESGVPLAVREEAEAVEEVGDLLAALEKSVLEKSMAAHPSRKQGQGPEVGLKFTRPATRSPTCWCAPCASGSTRANYEN